MKQDSTLTHRARDSWAARTWNSGLHLSFSLGTQQSSSQYSRVQSMAINATESLQKEDSRYWRVARTHCWRTGVAGPVYRQLCYQRVVLLTKGMIITSIECRPVTTRPARLTGTLRLLISVPGLSIATSKKVTGLGGTIVQLQAAKGCIYSLYWNHITNVHDKKKSEKQTED